MVTDQLTPLQEGSPHGVRSDSFRPDVMGVRGAVVANHPLAAQAGLRILQAGGNAVDAAVAIGFSLTMAEPTSSGIGGDGFVMVYMKDRGRIEVANGTGAAPLAATPDRFKPGGIVMKGILSVSVPGIVDALLSAHERFGELPLATCIEPAIELCEEGVPVSNRQARLIASEEALLDYETTRAVYAPDGRPAAAGYVVRNPDLARSMQLIAEGGRDAFYNGPIAHEIVRVSNELGGLLTAADFARHQVRWDPPIATTYRGHSVYEAPPNSCGHVLLQELNLVEGFDLPSLGAGTSATIHVMAEAKRLAFADREAYLADPEFVDVPIEGLLSKKYAAERAKLIDPERAAPPGSVPEGDPWAFQDAPPDESRRFHRRFEKVTEHAGDTTHFCVVDRWGNAVGELQSLQMNFGSALIAGRTGILLNNRMTTWHLGPGHTNLLHGGQRVRHTMNPVMAFSAPADEGGTLEIVCGTPGGDTQVQTNFQLITHAYDFGYTSSECVEAPRWTQLQDPMNSTWPHTTREALQIERRAGGETIDGLRDKGHEMHVLGSWEATGSTGMIRIHTDSGVLMAAADPRRDGQAVTW